MRRKREKGEGRDKTLGKSKRAGNGYGRGSNNRNASLINNGLGAPRSGINRGGGGKTNGRSGWGIKTGKM